VMEAQERGAKIIVVDPREVQIGRLADLYLRFRPGTDVAWLNGLMNIIISEGLEDKAFVKERTEGFEELRQVVMEYTPERVEEISGIPADGLRAAARMYATHKPSAILYAMGITQHTTGTDNVKSCANLAMLTGNMGVAGGGVNPLRGQNNVQGACDLGGLPNVYPGYQNVTLPETKAKFEAAWGVEGLSDRMGLKVTEMIPAACERSIRALYVMGENPMLSDPDVNHARHCLQQLDFMVVQDIFLTETAQLAHVVLPGTSFAEKDGTFTGTDRRIQRVRQAVEPAGESKPDWEIICLLAQRMGAAGFDFAAPEKVADEIAQVSPIYRRAFLRTAGARRVSTMAGDRSRPPRHALLAQGQIQPGTGPLSRHPLSGSGRAAGQGIPLNPDHRPADVPLAHGHNDPPLGQAGARSARGLRGAPSGRRRRHWVKRCQAGAGRQPAGGDRIGGAGNRAYPAGRGFHPLPFCRGGRQRAHQRCPRPRLWDSRVQGVCGAGGAGIVQEIGYWRFAPALLRKPGRFAF